MIYYFHNLNMPLFLVTIFAKSQKSDLDSEELKRAKQFAEAISKESKKRK